MIVLLAVMAFAINSNAQENGVLEPVKWEFTTLNYDNGEMAIVATATIDENWHLYSQNIDDGGPIPTSFMFNPIEGVGEMRQITMLEKGEKVHDKYDELFEMQLKYYDEKVIFIQYFKADVVKEFTGYVEFMTCDDKRCLPPTMVEFSFILDPSQEITPKPVSTVGQSVSKNNLGRISKSKATKKMAPDVQTAPAIENNHKKK